MLLVTEKKQTQAFLYMQAVLIFLMLFYVPTKKPSRSLIHSVSDTQMQLAICKITEPVKIWKQFQLKTGFEMQCLMNYMELSFKCLSEQITQIFCSTWKTNLIDL